MYGLNEKPQEMDYTIYLSAKDFEQQEQFTVGVVESTNCIQTNGMVRIKTSAARIQLGQTDNNQQDHRTEMRSQPSRAAKYMKQPQISAKIINAKADPIVKNTKSQQRSTALCKTSHLKKNIVIEVGQLVLAKQKHSVPWPSRIIAIKKDSVSVFFFGDGRFGPVKKCNLYSVCESKDIILNCLRRNITDYKKGILEMERILGMPENLSLVNLI